MNWIFGMCWRDGSINVYHQFIWMLECSVETAIKLTKTILCGFKESHLLIPCDYICEIKDCNQASSPYKWRSANSYHICRHFLFSCISRMCESVISEGTSTFTNKQGSENYKLVFCFPFTIDLYLHRFQLHDIK